MSGTPTLPRGARRAPNPPDGAASPAGSRGGVTMERQRRRRRGSAGSRGLPPAARALPGEISPWFHHPPPAPEEKFLLRARGSSRPSRARGAGAALAPRPPLRPLPAPPALGCRAPHRCWGTPARSPEPKAQLRRGKPRHSETHPTPNLPPRPLARQKRPQVKGGHSPRRRLSRGVGRGGRVNTAPRPGQTAGWGQPPGVDAYGRAGRAWGRVRRCSAGATEPPGPVGTPVRPLASGEQRGTRCCQCARPGVSPACQDVGTPTLCSPLSRHGHKRGVPELPPRQCRPCPAHPGFRPSCSWGRQEQRDMGSTVSPVGPVRRDREQPTRDRPPHPGSDFSGGSGAERRQRVGRGAERGPRAPGAGSAPRPARPRPPPLPGSIPDPRDSPQPGCKSDRRTGTATARSVPPCRPPPPVGGSVRSLPSLTCAPRPSSGPVPGPRPRLRLHLPPPRPARPPPLPPPPPPGLQEAPAPAPLIGQRAGGPASYWCGGAAHHTRHTPPPREGGGHAGPPPGPGVRCGRGEELSQRRGMAAVNGAALGATPGIEEGGARYGPPRRLARCQAPSAPRPLRPPSPEAKPAPLRSAPRAPEGGGTGHGRAGYGAGGVGWRTGRRSTGHRGGLESWAPRTGYRGGGRGAGTESQAPGGEWRTGARPLPGAGGKCEEPPPPPPPGAAKANTAPRRRYVSRAGGTRRGAPIQRRGRLPPPSPHPLGPGTGHLPPGRGTPLPSSIRPSVRPSVHLPRLPPAAPSSPPPVHLHRRPSVRPPPLPDPPGSGLPRGRREDGAGKSTENPLGAAAAAHPLPAPPPTVPQAASRGPAAPRGAPARSPRSVPAAALPVPPAPPAPGGGPDGAARTHLPPARTRCDRDRAGAAEPPGPSQPDRRRGRKDRAVIAARARPPAEGTAGPGSRAPRAAGGGTDTRGDTGRGFGCPWHRLFGL
ncbi:basic proline-rich protein-like [Caloenas nicobarica]|uniref:basic proline-rich protein-like n=1 Tax=Caloenas nicobarica TaxID=187106 RepID=UPI0032B83BB6